MQNLSEEAKEIASQIASAAPRMGDIRKIAAKVKINHELALELWQTADFHLRLTAALIFDKRRLTEEFLDVVAADLVTHPQPERDQITDWLLANQLSKDKRLASLMETWENHSSPIMRRLFWYHQARLRWVGQVPPSNTASLMTSLETKLADEEPGVQWAMNFCACQIGLHELAFRLRCISLGERLGLYKDDHVLRNCTPSYIPEFIRIEAAKRESKA